MTAPTHEQEYIISLSELKRANVFMFTNKLKELSARPLLSAIQQEREKVLDAISACVGQWIPFGSDPTAVMAREIKEKIESLRSEQHER